MSDERRFWEERWAEGRIGFHQEAVHEDLLRWGDRFLSDGPHRVLVPLCGKSVDLSWLAEEGHEVIGVELVPRAVDELFREQGLTPEREERGPFVVYTAGPITVYQGDVFDLDVDLLRGAVDRVWDRAALIALPEARRGEYVAHLRRLLDGDWTILLNAVDYDVARMTGPPHSVDEAEVWRHYADRRIQVLDRRDLIDAEPRWREAGHHYWNVTTYLIS